MLPVSTSLDQREVITALKTDTANPGIFVPTTAEDLNALNMQVSSELEHIGERLNTELLAEEKHHAMYDAQRHAVPVHKYVTFVCKRKNMHLFGNFADGTRTSNTAT